MREKVTLEIEMLPVQSSPGGRLGLMTYLCYQVPGNPRIETAVTVNKMGYLGLFLKSGSKVGFDATNSAGNYLFKVNNRNTR